jgi:ribonuclease D
MLEPAPPAAGAPGADGPEPNRFAGKRVLMSLSLRTFEIGAATREADEAAIAEFLSSVDVDRVDTAFSDGAWRILVHYRDARAKEEAAQIASVVVSALKVWRQRVAQASGETPEAVLPDATILAVARYVPTTQLELKLVLGDAAEACSGHHQEIVAVVRETLNQLV